MTEMPPLPRPWPNSFPYSYTAEQMREFWIAGRRAGLEEAAALCWERSKNAPGAMSSEAMLCAAHIRSL